MLLLVDSAGNLLLLTIKMLLLTIKMLLLNFFKIATGHEFKGLWRIAKTP